MKQTRNSGAGLVMMYLRRHVPAAFIIIIAGLVCHALTLVMLISLGVFLHLFSGLGGGKLQAVEWLGLPFPATISGFLFFFLLAILIRFLLSWFKLYQEGMIGERFAAWLKGKLFLYVSQQKQDAAPVSTMMIVFANEARAMQQMLVKGYLVFISDLLFLLLALWVMYQLSPFLTGAIIILLSFYAGILKLLGRITKKSAVRKRKRQSALLKLVVDSFHRSASGQSVSVQQYDSKMEKLQESIRPYLRVQSFLRALYPLQMYFLLWIVMILLVNQKGIKGTDPGMLTAYLLLLLQLFPVMKAIMRAENWRIKGAVASRRYQFICDEGLEKTGPSPVNNLKAPLAQGNTAG